MDSETLTTALQVLLDGKKANEIADAITAVVPKDQLETLFWQFEQRCPVYVFASESVSDLREYLADMEIPFKADDDQLAAALKMFALSYDYPHDEYLRSALTKYLGEMGVITEEVSE